MSRGFKLILFVPLFLIAALIVVISLPWLIIFLFGLLEPNPPRPENTYGEFPFRLVYMADGETITVEDTLSYEFNGYGWNEGVGKYIKWNVNLLNGNKPRNFTITDDDHYELELFYGYIQGQGGTRILIDLGNPQYYLGYKKDTDYSPGRVSISSPHANGVIGEGDLWSTYNIKIIEAQFAQPLVGNGITEEESSPYSDIDTAQLSVGGLTIIPQPSSYPPNTEQVAYQLINDTDKPFMLKQSFYIQEKRNGKWEDVYNDRAVGFSQEQIILEPHTQITRVFEISKYVRDIPAGQYRIISPVLVPVMKSTYEIKAMSGEFMINGD